MVKEINLKYTYKKATLVFAHNNFIIEFLLRTFKENISKYKNILCILIILYINILGISLVLKSILSITYMYRIYGLRTIKRHQVQNYFIATNLF